MSRIRADNDKKGTCTSAHIRDIRSSFRSSSLNINAWNVK